ncbi:MAG: HEAT repeat domain-containing protein [Thermodesulfobacteriota bacterium]
MAENFRLLYLKSSDLGSSTQKEETPSPINTHDSHSLELYSSQEILRQAKEDLTHPDPKVRSMAVQYYIEKSNLSINLPILQEILEDKDPGVRAQALSSLIRLGNPIISPFLKRHLKDNDEKVRRVALKGLFQIKEKIDIHLLKPLLNDESPWVRRKMATMLGWMEVEGGKNLLLEMVKDKEPMVRKAALSSLLALYPEEGELEMGRAITDSDHEIRTWVKQQLNRRLQKPSQRKIATF